MNAIENKKMEKSKLLAAIAVLALVVCAFAAVMPSVDAADPQYVDVKTSGEEAIVVTDFATLQEALNSAIESGDPVEIVIQKSNAEASFEITESITIPENVTLFIGNAYDANADGFTVTINDGVTVTVQGDVYNNLGKNKTSASIIVKGSVVFDGGLLYSTGALSFGENGKILNAFFTNSNGKTGTQYKHMYSSDIDAIAPYVNAVDYSDTEGSTKVSAIYSYGEVSVGSINSNVSNTTIFVGGVDGEKNPAQVTFTEDANITPAAINVKTGSEAANNGKVTLISGNIAGTYVNNGTTTINGTVSGTIDNQNGSVNVTKYDAPQNEAGLSVNGGDVSAASNVSLPILNDVTLKKGTIEYMTYTYTSAQDVIINFGIPTVSFQEDRNYGGSTVTVSVFSYTVNNSTNDVKSFDAFAGYNQIYNDPDNALQNNKEFGECIDAGNEYYVNVGFSVTTGTDYGTINVETVVQFSIKPVPVNVSIVGNGTAGALSDKTYTGEQIKPVAGTDLDAVGVDFIVQAVINGEKVTLTPNEDYDVIYGENTNVGENKGSVKVTLKGNYSGSAEATFDIVQGLDHIDVTPEEGEKFYVGQIVSADDFVSIGVYANGDRTEEPLDTNYISVDVEVFEKAGPVTLTFTYLDNDNKVYGTCEVEVIGITGIEVADVSDTDKYTKEYLAGSSFDSNGMKVTVTYEGGAMAVFQNTTEAVGTADEGFVQVITGDGVITDDMSTVIEFDYGIFKDKIGQVDVTVSYYGEEGTFQVNVTGCIATYMVGDEIYGYQAGAYGALAAVFNYVGEAPTGQAFSGWQVRGTEAIYQPGDMYRFGEDTEMWESGLITFDAQFVDVPTTEIAVTVDGKGYYASAVDAEQAMYLIWNGSSLGPIAPQTMFVIFDVTGSESKYYVGELYDASGNLIYYESLDNFTSPNGQKAWYFSFAEGQQVNMQNPTFKLTDGVYTMKVYVATETGVRNSDAILTTTVMVSSEPAPVVPTVVDIIVSAKTQYVEGEQFVADVYAVYSNGYCVELDPSQYTVSPTKMILGLESVIVTYNENDKIYEIVKVTVEPAEPAVYDVTFVVGESSYTVSVVEGQAVAKPYDPAAPEGQEFVGWFVKDVEYNFETAVNYNLIITAKFQDVAPVEPVYSEDIVISVYYQQGNRIVVSITAVDGYEIPAGSLTISGGYSYTTNMPGFGDVIVSDSYSATVDKIAEGTTSFVFSIDEYAFIAGVTSIDVVFTPEGGEPIQSNHMTFTYVASTEA